MRTVTHEELAARLRRCQGDDLPRRDEERFSGSLFDFLLGLAAAGIVICFVTLLLR